MCILTNIVVFDQTLLTPVDGCLMVASLALLRDNGAKADAAVAVKRTREMFVLIFIVILSGMLIASENHKV